MSDFEQDLSDALRATVGAALGAHEPSAWLDPSELAKPGWSHRDANGAAHGLLLGKRHGRCIGRQLDGNILSVVSSAGGISDSLLVPNLLAYEGSMLVIDPGGDLARQTAEVRRSKGQKVVAFDPFGASGLETGCFNPLDLLDQDRASVVDDAAALAAALITGDADNHWTSGARQLVKGLLLQALLLSLQERHLVSVSGRLFNKDPTLTDIARRCGCPPHQALATLLRSQDTAFGGELARIGTMFSAMPDREIGGMVSMARSQLAWLSSAPLQATLKTSDVALDTPRLAPTTVYVCLPHACLERYAPWVRLMLTVALETLARKPDGNVPVLVVVAKGGKFGRVPALENATFMSPASDVRLWLTFNSITELKRQHPAAWRTMVANTDVMTFWDTHCPATLEFIGAQLGIAALSLERLLGRETRRCLVMSAERAPVIVERLSRDDPVLTGGALR